MLLQVAVRDIGQLTDFELFVSKRELRLKGGRSGLASDTAIGGQLEGGRSGLASDTAIGGQLEGGRSGLASDTAIGGQLEGGRSGLASDTAIGGQLEGGRSGLASDTAIGGQVLPGVHPGSGPPPVQLHEPGLDHLQAFEEAHDFLVTAR